MFVYIMSVENAAAKGPIEENPILSFIYEQLGTFLESYNGNTFIDNSSQKYQLYTAFTSWQVTDSGYKNFCPITVYGETCFTDNVETYTFVDTGDAYVMTSSDGTQVGTYEKLYQFAYLNSGSAVTTERMQYTNRIYDDSITASATEAVRTSVSSVPETTEITTTEAAVQDESEDFSVGTYAAVAGGILLVGCGIIAVIAKRRKDK